MGIKPLHPNQLMVESDRCAFAKGLLGRNLLVFWYLISYLSVIWRNILDFACVSPNIFLQLTNKYKIRCEEDQQSLIFCKYPKSTDQISGGIWSVNGTDFAGFEVDQYKHCFGQNSVNL